MTSGSLNPDRVPSDPPPSKIWKVGWSSSPVMRFPLLLLANHTRYLVPSGRSKLTGVRLTALGLDFPPRERP